MSLYFDLMGLAKYQSWINPLIDSLLAYIHCWHSNNFFSPHIILQSHYSAVTILNLFHFPGASIPATFHIVLGVSSSYYLVSQRERRCHQVTFPPSLNHQTFLLSSPISTLSFGKRGDGPPPCKIQNLPAVTERLPSPTFPGTLHNQKFFSLQ